MCEQVGLTVHRLVRVAVGPIELGSLRPGEWRDLSAAEMAALAALVKGRAGRQKTTAA